MSLLTASDSRGELAAQDWTQWMQWDGQSDSIDLKDVALSSVPANVTEIHSPNTQTHFPVSPSTTANGDRRSSIDTTQYGEKMRPSFDLPTPSHSSNSPDSPDAPTSRLSGDTLWDQTPIDGIYGGTKRKFSDELSPLDAKSKGASKPAPKKRPHNIIEKRYRANLNEKIAELRDSVPSLRVAKRAASGKEDAEEEDEDLDGMTPSNKLNKASILTKATEYIRHLELRNKKLDDENTLLKQRLLKLDKLLAQGNNSSNHRDEAFTSQSMLESTPAPSTVEEGSSSTSNNPPQGLLPVSDVWKKFRASSVQTEHYGHIYDTPNEGAKRNGWPMKLMVGSLAGLMIMEGFSEGDTSSDSAKRGLFGIPLEFLDGWWFLRSPNDFIRAFMIFCRSGGMFPMIKGFFALSTLAFLLFTYLFNSKPSPPPKAQQTSEPEQLPSLASPIEVRRAAWLTSTQILHIPNHSFIPEWTALTCEWFKYTVRLVIGRSLYRWITGRSNEDEAARIKAWDIAIDAQLAGGDVEISRSRLVLTIFASGLLPRTPARLMLKALHCRVVLQGVGRKGSIVNRFWDRIGAYFANREWVVAQKLHAGLPAGHTDRLPRYAAALLAKDCNEVMLDSVIQRSSNLLYDRSTTEATDLEDGLMNVVVDDHAIRSPIDALCAWYSSHQLRKALVASMTHEVQRPNHEFDYLLHSAIAIAPESSAAHTRAIAVKAAFFEGMRLSNIETVVAALPAPRSSTPVASPVLSPDSLPTFIDSSTPTSACSEISVVLQCARIMSKVQDFARGDATSLQQAKTMFVHLPSEVKDTTLLTFAPVYFTLRTLMVQDVPRNAAPSDAALAFTKPIQTLYRWSRIEGPDSVVVPEQTLTTLQKFYDCTETYDLTMSRRPSNFSHDTGYGSSEE